jgi:hypothetical protein
MKHLMIMLTIVIISTNLVLRMAEHGKLLNSISSLSFYLYKMGIKILIVIGML